MKKILIIVLAFFAVASFAADKKHMVLATTNGSASFIDSNDEYKLSFNVGGGYYYTMNSFLQVGGNLSYSAFENIGDATYSLAPGAIFYLPLKQGEGIENAFYCQANLGYMGSFGDAADVSDFYYNLQVGKRFELVTNISYSPSVSFLHVPDQADPSYTFNFLQFSALF